MLILTVTISRLRIATSMKQNIWATKLVIIETSLCLATGNDNETRTLHVKYAWRRHWLPYLFTLERVAIIHIMPIKVVLLLLKTWLKFILQNPERKRIHNSTFYNYSVYVCYLHTIVIEFFSNKNTVNMLLLCWAVASSSFLSEKRWSKIQLSNTTLGCRILFLLVTITIGQAS